MPGRARSHKDHFTATEIGTLLESLRGDIRVIAEGVADLHNKVDQHTKLLDQQTTELATIRTAVHGLVPMARQSTEDLRGIKADLRATRDALHAFDERLKVVEARVSV